MLLDMQRFGRWIDRRFPPRPDEPSLLRAMEKALASYVRGQFALSLIIGTTAGIGLWLLAVLGLLPHAQQYALLFGGVGRRHRDHPVPRPVARRDPAVHLRARRAPDLGAVGRAALPRHPPDRGPRRRAERDGERVAAASAARDLRARAPAPSSTACPELSLPCRCWQSAGRSGSSSPTGSGSSDGGATSPLEDAPVESRRRAPQVTLLTARGVARRFGSRVALDRPTSTSRVARSLRSSARTEPASRRCSRSSPVRSNRAKARSTVRSASAGCRSARRTTAGSPPSRTCACSLRSSAFRRRAQTSLLAEFELPAGTRAGALSVGNRQRLDVALSLLSSPQVLLLDEPTASLDPAQRERVVADRTRCRRGRRRVLVATHHWEEFAGLADRTLELVDGHLT